MGVRPSAPQRRSRTSQVVRQARQGLWRAPRVLLDAPAARVSLRHPDGQRDLTAWQDPLGLSAEYGTALQTSPIARAVSLGRVMARAGCCSGVCGTAPCVNICLWRDLGSHTYSVGSTDCLVQF